MDLKQVKSIYFLGIGGIGMSALAKYFLFKGVKVSGYDKVETDLTKNLSASGAIIHYEDNVSLIPSSEQIDLVVYTPAISNTNAEFTYFKQNNYLLKKRANVLGNITKDYNTIAVAGTHGKTTTSSIIAHILSFAEKGGVAFLGGITTNYNSNILLSKGDIAVVEADEYDRSFLELSPDTIVLTSLDADHLDIYEKPEQVVESFLEFSRRLNDGKKPIVYEAIESHFNEKLTYGFKPSSDLQLINVSIIDHAYNFDLMYNGELYSDFTFQLPGRYNLLNATGAVLACMVNGLSISEIKNGLSTFSGVKRRFEVHIDTPSCTFIDDYAHHPKEIEVLINAIIEFYPSRQITAIFQPHLYSRTRDFMTEFSQSLSRLDKLFLLPIYPAREKPISGISSKVLFDLINVENKVLVEKNQAFYNDMLVDNNQVVVTIGAGDIDLHVPKIKSFLMENA